MKKMIAAIDRYAAHYSPDPAVQKKAGILVKGLLLVSLNAFAYAAFCHFISWEHGTYSMILQGVLLGLLPLLLRLRAPLLLVGVLQSLICMGTITFGLMESGGIFSPFLGWAAAVPVFALLFANRYWSLIVAVIFTGIVTCFGIATYNGSTFPVMYSAGWTNFYIIYSTVGLIFMLYLLTLVFERGLSKANLKLEERTREVETVNAALTSEKEKSEELLLNILPAGIMEELKMTGRTTARSYELVSVLFADFKDFTIISEQLSPEELVSGIDEYFEAFDRLADKHGVEKIKTVGDAYICASGLPEPNGSNPEIIVRMGLDILATVAELGARRQAAGLRAFDIRVGVHSGPVVAGVVGIRKFAYDIWGDTVNTAARMQQHSEPGKLNVSGTTYELIRDCFDCTHRGEVEAKHKGRIPMYFVDGLTTAPVRPAPASAFAQQALS